MNEALKVTDTQEMVYQLLAACDMNPQPFDPNPDFSGYTVSFDEAEQVIGLVYIYPAQFAFYLAYLMPIPVAQFASVVALISRINNELIIGNFEADYDALTIRFKTSIDYSQTVLSEQLVRNMLLTAIETVEQLSPAITAVASGQQAVMPAYQTIFD